MASLRAPPRVCILQILPREIRFMKVLQIHTLLLALLFGVNMACENPRTVEFDKSGSTGTDYVGSESLKGTFYQGRIHVVSNRSLTRVVFKINSSSYAGLQTHPLNGNVKSWHTGKFQFTNGDVVTANATFSNRSQKSLTMRVMQTASGTTVVLGNTNSNGGRHYPQGLDTLPHIQDNYDSTDNFDNNTSNDTYEDYNDNNDSNDNDVYNGVVAGNEVDVNEYMRQFNAYRAKYNLSAMRLSRELVEVAAPNNPPQNQAQVSGHHTNAGYPEIAFYGPGTIEAAIQGWHDSWAHRELMQGDYNCTGIHRLGYAWTQVFSNSSSCEY